MKKDPRSFSTHQLHNGFRIHTKEIEAPWTYIGLAIGVGNRADPVGKEGLTHILEHTLSDGGRSHTQKEQELRVHGIRSRGASTGMESMRFILQGIEGAVPQMLSELSSMFRGQLLADEITYHREIVRQEREANPHSPLESELCRRLYCDHRMATANGLPSDEALDAITGEDLVSQCNTFAIASNMHLICYGAETALAANIASKQFESFRNGAVPAYDPVTEASPINGGTTTRRRPEGSKSNGWAPTFCLRLPRLSGTELYVILRTARSILFQELREQQKAVYDFRFSTHRAPDHSLLYISTLIGEKRGQEIIDTMHHLLSSFHEKEAEWEQSREEILINRQLDDPSGKNILYGALEDAILHGAPIGLQTELNEIRQISLDRLRQICEYATLPGRLCATVIER